MNWLTNIVFWHWLILAAVLLGLEMLAPGTFFLWVGISAGIVGFLLWLFPAISWEWQLLVFALLAVASVLSWRFYLRHHPIITDEPVLNRRGEQYIGRVFTLDDAIINGVGKLRVDDTTWKVRGDDMAAGAKVRVTGVEGVLLRVEASES